MSQTQLRPTHCWDLVRTIPADSKDFTRKDLHYLADGLQATYICHLDKKEYEITIKPIRPYEI